MLIKVILINYKFIKYYLKCLYSMSKSFNINYTLIYNDVVENYSTLSEVLRAYKILYENNPDLLIDVYADDNRILTTSYDKE